MCLIHSLGGACAWLTGLQPLTCDAPVIKSTIGSVFTIIHVITCN